MTNQEAASRLREMAFNCAPHYPKAGDECRDNAAACRLGARALENAIPDRWPLRWDKNPEAQEWAARLPIGEANSMAQVWFAADTGRYAWSVDRPDEDHCDMTVTGECTRPQDARRAAERAVSRALWEELQQARKGKEAGK
jgi:hypothetical protein